jgi:hypothetical protein
MGRFNHSFRFRRAGLALLLGTAGCETGAYYSSPYDPAPAPVPGPATRAFDGRWQGEAGAETILVGMGSIMCTPMRLQFTVSDGTVTGGGKRMSIGVRPYVEYVKFDGTVTGDGNLQASMKYRHDRTPLYILPGPGARVSGQATETEIVANLTDRYCRYAFVFKRV